MRVFLSHTSLMAKVPEGRSFVQAAMDGVNEVKAAKAHDMRAFLARDQSPAAYSVEEVLETGIYVGIIGFDHGSRVSDGDPRSYTELEFDTATEAGMTRLVFLLDDQATGLPGSVFTAVTDEQRRLPDQTAAGFGSDPGFFQKPG